MPRLLTASAAAVVMALVTLPLAAQPTFRSATHVVPIYVTVVDGEGRLVPGLTRDDFTVLDNGAPQDLTLFDDTPRPFSAVVMLDTSLSMTLDLDVLKRAAEQFLIRLTEDDLATVGAFNDKIQFASEFTNDRDGLVGALNDLMYGNPTRLYDAVDASMTRLRDAEKRKVVLVFTDGDDTASKNAGLGDVMRRGRDEEVMVYAIGLESTMNVGGVRQRTRPGRGLRRLAEETGGGYFELKTSSALGETFTRVAQELRSQYLLGFSPKALDGKAHKLEVRLKQGDLKARSRRSYLAVPPGSGSAGGE